MAGGSDKLTLTMFLCSWSRVRPCSMVTDQRVLPGKAKQSKAKQSKSRKSQAKRGGEGAVLLGLGRVELSSVKATKVTSRLAGRSRQSQSSVSKTKATDLGAARQ